jgi:hypothetical protein
MRRRAWKTAYDSWGACCSSSVARWGSDDASVFIWPRISRSWAGGSVLRVLEMASVQVRPGGISFPGGRGGSVDGWTEVYEAPFAVL